MLTLSIGYKQAFLQLHIKYFIINDKRQVG